MTNGMNKKIKLAIFDIDGTIFRSSLLIELINGLVREGVFPKIASKEMEKEYLAWLNRKGGYEDYIEKVIRIHLKYIRGRSLAEVDAVAEQTVLFMRDRVYRFTRDLISRLKKQNYRLVSISGSPTYIVSKYARVLGFQAYFGSEYEVLGGKFTGTVTNLETFYKKAEVLRGYIKTNKLSVNLKNSIAIGDTESDAPMLSLVGKPIAFNPNLALARMAKRKNWKIVVERKDVIYNIEKFSFV
jgi:HAD superfamily hydrolase (TIGR01490 family)